jgi:hypothetical protein
VPLQENILHHWDEIARKKDALAESLSWSVAGRNLHRESKIFADSSVIKNIKNALLEKSANPIDRFKMAQYLALSLDDNPEYNLPRFAEYLGGIAEKTHSQRRAGYYNNLRHMVLELINSNELADYISVYNEFKNDSTAESTLARNILERVTSNMQKIMGEYA